MTEVPNDDTNIPQPLPRSFLIEQGFCCHNRCTNCPYDDYGNIIELDVEKPLLDEIRTNAYG